MCTTVYSSLLLFLSTTLTIFIMCGTKMATDGLPLSRQERGADPDILAGADFLSVFMGSTLRRAFRETTTESPTTSSPIFEAAETELSPYIRTSRSTPDVAQSTEPPPETTVVNVKELENLENSSDSSLSDGVIVAVSVSSSVGRTLINKHISTNLNLQDLDDSSTAVSTIYADQEFVASEEHPSIIAEANKSEFHVDEKDPITRNSDLETSEFSRSYPASVHALPGPQHIPFSPPADFLREGAKDKLPPYHHTVIYHDRPGDSGARSVSYSTVIQSIPQPVEKWEGDEKPKSNERHERNYNGESFRNKFDDVAEKKNSSHSHYFTTSRPIRNTEATPKNWEKPEVNYEEQATKKSITSERNWEVDEKIYSAPMTPLPKIYGQPEQNYEVDEAISVVTNGRAHGVQPSQNPVPTKSDPKDGESKKDGNQKVGYVVEGKNYRKYRLEERTPDGFIVGEYGVVNHDDGSLRGVRYTADGTISRRLIHDALMKFLSL